MCSAVPVWATSGCLGNFRCKKVTLRAVGRRTPSVCLGVWVDWVKIEVRELAAHRKKDCGWCARRLQKKFFFARDFF